MRKGYSNIKGKVKDLFVTYLLVSILGISITTSISSILVITKPSCSLSSYVDHLVFIRF